MCTAGRRIRIRGRAPPRKNSIESRTPEDHRAVKAVSPVPGGDEKRSRMADDRAADSPKTEESDAVDCPTLHAFARDPFPGSHRGAGPTIGCAEMSFLDEGVTMPDGTEASSVSPTKLPYATSGRAGSRAPGRGLDGGLTRDLYDALSSFRSARSNPRSSPGRGIDRRASRASLCAAKALCSLACLADAMTGQVLPVAQKVQSVGN
jgi:hypothetical protein